MGMIIDKNIVSLSDQKSHEAAYLSNSQKKKLTSAERSD